MDQFGVQTPELKALAEQPEFPGMEKDVRAPKGRDQTPLAWNGITGRNIRDEGDMSVFGAPGVTGVVVTKVDTASPLGTAGVRVNDVILGVNGQVIGSVNDLKKSARSEPGSASTCCARKE